MPTAGRPITIDTTIGITYDAQGRMVEQNRSGTYQEIAYAPTGEKVALLSGTSLQFGYVPLPQGAMAVYTSAGLAYYRHPDWLGSSRLTTTTSQTVHGDQAYAPFGEGYATAGTPDLSFTGMNDDTDANLYDFPAREYGIQGRWPSPDPAGLAAVNPSNPQSWNRYAYVLNNPLVMTDPSGLEGGVFPCFDPVSCIIDIVGAIFEFLDFLIGSPPPPQAAPAPPGGYGGGIDPYGTWDEQVPAGVQVFPSTFPGGASPGGSGCTYGSGSCGGIGNSLQGMPPIPPQVWDEAGDFAIRVIVWGTAIYESAKIATSQAAHNTYNAAKSYLSQQLDKLHPSPPQNNSGRQKKCHIQSVGPGYCTYVCEDGTTTVDPSCVPIIYVPHQQPW